MENIEVTIFPKEKSPRLFKNKFLEYLTKTHPLVIDAMYLVIGTFLITFYYKHYSTSVSEISIAFIIGFFTWTLAEYCMHRFLYHSVKDASFSTGIHYLFHGIHHEFPNDKDRIVLPPVPSLLFAAAFFGLFYLIMGKYAFVFGPGFLIGYVAYMNVHYVVHKVAMPKKYNFWWRFHNIHHFQQHDRAFGVTSSLWDHVFGTMPEKNRKTVVIKVGKDHPVHPH
jgi:sterol desaturase/sphingolipid hydroxylase (fatty acid hydroxylase superfamily)